VHLGIRCLIAVGIYNNFIMLVKWDSDFYTFVLKGDCCRILPQSLVFLSVQFLCFLPHYSEIGTGLLCTGPPYGGCTITRNEDLVIYNRCSRFCDDNDLHLHGLCELVTV